MNTKPLNSLKLLLTLAALVAYTATFVGCNSGGSESSGSASSSTADHDDHDHDDDHAGHDHDDDHAGHDHDDDHAGHDHDDDHAGHDHPAHGPHGGHLIELSGGAHAEWVHNDQQEEILVYVDELESVDAVEMKVTIEGEPKSYQFNPVEGESYYRIVSPDLLFAIKMGSNVDTQLVITTSDGEAAGQVKHHAH